MYMKITVSFIIPFFCFMVPLYAQDALKEMQSQQINYDQELAALEIKLQEIESSKKEHQQNKEALKKQLAVHNHRTFDCNRVRMKKIEKKLEKLAESNLSGVKKEDIEALEMELLHLKSNTIDIFLKKNKNNPT